MYKLLVAGLLVFYCGLVSSHHHFHTTRCLPALGKYPFDEEKFSGDWYVVSKAFRPMKFPGLVTCDKLKYSAEKMGNVTRTSIHVTVKKDDGTEHVWEGKGQALKPGMASSTSMAWKNSEKDNWHSVLKHAVLATDYETYALIHACKEHYDEKTDMFSKMVFDQIWSRSAAIDESLLKTLKSVMSSIDIADDEWEDVDNSAC